MPVPKTDRDIVGCAIANGYDEAFSEAFCDAPRAERVAHHVIEALQVPDVLQALRRWVKEQGGDDDGGL